MLRKKLSIETDDSHVEDKDLIATNMSSQHISNYESKLYYDILTLGNKINGAFDTKVAVETQEILKYVYSYKEKLASWGFDGLNSQFYASIFGLLPYCYKNPITYLFLPIADISAKTLSYGLYSVGFFVRKGIAAKNTILKFESKIVPVKESKEGFPFKFSQTSLLGNLCELAMYNLNSELTDIGEFNKEASAKFGGLCQSLCILTSILGFEHPTVRALIHMSNNSGVINNPTGLRDGMDKLNAISQKILLISDKFLKKMATYGFSILSIQDRIKYLMEAEYKTINPELVKLALQAVGKNKYIQICLIDDFKTQAAHMVLLKQKENDYYYFDPSDGGYVENSLEKICMHVNNTLSSRNVMAIDFIDLERVICTYSENNDKLFSLELVIPIRKSNKIPKR